MMIDPLRLSAAAGVTLGYLGLCALWLRILWRKPALNADAGVHWVCYASQTGSAEALAHSTAAALAARGESAQVLPLNRLDAATLETCRTASFIVSTTGDGDVPDSGVRFVEQLMRQRLPLKALRYAVLALGNRSYTHYCAFGHGLDAWLADCGARARFPRIDVDNHDADALTAWHDALGIKELGPVAPGIAAPLSEPEVWQTATLARRQHMNPGSAGEPVYWVELELPASGAQSQRNDWEAGDIVDVRLAADATPRTYTLATLPDESDSPQTRTLGLIVRQQRHPDGSLGVMSGWLTHAAQPGDTLPLKLRAQSNFRIDGNIQRSLILIGNGTGLAGLAAHLKAREASGGPPCWLIFGERHIAHDFLLQTQLERWRDDGVLARLDCVFSRDSSDHPYVQHRLAASQDAVRQWIARDAAIYVCGSRLGMAEGVDHALAEALGRDVLDTLAVNGRYRRDVY